MLLVITCDGQLALEHPHMKGYVPVQGFTGPTNNPQWLEDKSYGPPF